MGKIRVRGRRNRSGTRSTAKKKAEAKLTEPLHSINTGAYVDPTKDTLEVFLNKWLETVKPNLAGKTYERYSEIVKSNIIPALGHTVLSRVTPMQIQAFYSKCLESGRKNRRGGLSALTVLHFHRVLREALHQGVTCRPF